MQADSYYEFLNPERAELLEKSVAYAKQIHHEFPTLTLQELAVELCVSPPCEHWSLGLLLIF